MTIVIAIFFGDSRLARAKLGQTDLTDKSGRPGIEVREKEKIVNFVFKK